MKTKKSRPGLSAKGLARGSAIDIWYFSGTGNTQIVAKKLSDILAAKGMKPRLLRMEKSGKIAIAPGAVLGLGFPVAGFSTYPVVWDFIKRLPKGKGNQCFMFDTMGGMSLAGLEGRLKMMVRKKGYMPIGSIELQMPPNIFIKTSEAYNSRIIRKAFARITKFADKLVSGTSWWLRVPVVSDIGYLFGRSMVWMMEWKWQQKLVKMKTDRNKCDQCGVCEKKCPIGNISMAEYPVFGDNCMYCQRCASVCPKHAIPFMLSPRSMQYKAPGAAL